MTAIAATGQVSWDVPRRILASTKSLSFTGSHIIGRSNCSFTANVNPQEVLVITQKDAFDETTSMLAFAHDVATFDFRAIDPNGKPCTLSRIFTPKQSPRGFEHLSSENGLPSEGNAIGANLNEEIGNVKTNTAIGYYYGGLLSVLAQLEQKASD